MARLNESTASAEPIEICSYKDPKAPNIVTPCLYLFLFSKKTVRTTESRNCSSKLNPITPNSEPRVRSLPLTL